MKPLDPVRGPVLARQSPPDLGWRRGVRAGAVSVVLLAGSVGAADAQFWPRSYETIAPPAVDPVAPKPLDRVAPRPLDRRPHHRAAKVDEPKSRSDPGAELPKGPFEVIVSIEDQRVSLYGSAGLIERSRISSGMHGHPTPLGVFTVIQKQRWHRSNIYSAAPMPYMQRITWSGVALHAGILPGYPASHGCIRLSYDFATKLWRITRLGTRVIVARSDTTPVEIVDTHLLALGPKIGEPDARLRSASNPAGAPAAEIKTAAAGPPEFPVAAAMAEAAKPAPRKVQPISVLVSRKQGKLFVRQGFTTLLHVPVTIRDPDKPLGTFVFTAMDLRDGGQAMRWVVVAMPEEPPGKSDGPAATRKGGATGSKEAQKRGRKRDDKPAAPTAPGALARAGAALDRIDISKDALERISELLAPGSSLIVSDYGISEETDSDTDFIIVTR